MLHIWLFCGICVRFTSVHPRKFEDMILQHGYILEKETVLCCVNQSYYVCFLCCSKRLTRWSRQASKVRSIIHSVWFILSDLSCLHGFLFWLDCFAHSNIVKRIHKNIGEHQTTLLSLKNVFLYINIVNYTYLSPSYLLASISRKRHNF